MILSIAMKDRGGGHEGAYPREGKAENMKKRDGILCYIYRGGKAADTKLPTWMWYKGFLLARPLQLSSEVTNSDLVMTSLQALCEKVSNFCILPPSMENIWQQSTTDKHS